MALSIWNLFRRGRKSASSYDILREIAGLWRPTASGKLVNVDTAIGVSAVFSCARVIGNGLAQVPLKLMRESADGKTRLPAKDHQLYDLLALRPNRVQTSFEFRQTIAWHLELTGDAFVFLSRMATGRILEMTPLDPGAVTVKQSDSGVLTYEVRGKDGTTRVLPASSVWHIRGPSWNGYTGLPVVQVARDAIGLAMATEESQGSMHQNGVRPTGAWSVEGTLSPTQYEALRKFIAAEHAGSGKAGGFMLMDRAAKWMSTQMTGVDAQHLETRKYQIEEVCRFFGVMPIMAGYSDKTATFASAEAMFLAHVVHCLSPRWTAFEQSLDMNLLTDAERAAGLYFDFVEEGMIRGSTADTKDAILGYVNGGILTPNEGRALLDRNPDADPASDKLRIPVNVAQEGGEPTNQPAAPME